MPDTITASHTVAIEDVEYQKGMLARLYRPSGAGPFPARAAGAWRRLDQQGPHRQRFHGEGARRKRHFRRLDRFPHAADRAASGLDPGHQSRHPLAQGECARVHEPAGMGRLVGHVERRAPGSARGNARLEPDLFRAPRPGRRRCEAGLGDLGLGRARPAPPLQPCEKGRQQGARRTCTTRSG